jgi:hypothetical protein
MKNRSINPPSSLQISQSNSLGLLYSAISKKIEFCNVWIDFQITMSQAIDVPFELIAIPARQQPLLELFRRVQGNLVGGHLIQENLSKVQILGFDF